MAKRPEDMTDAELDASLLGASRPVSAKAPEEMSDEELNAALAGGTPSGLDIINEPAPISKMDRALIQNLGDTEGGISYLQKNYPGMEARASDDGKIVVRMGNQGPYRPIDPKATDVRSFLSDLPGDITDFGSDFLSGLASGAGAAAGGALGAPTGPGAIASGAAGAAAAGGTYEALRSALGNYLGVNTGPSAEKIGSEAFWSAVPVPVLGTGAGAKEVAQVSKALGRNLSREELARFAQNQRGAVGVIADSPIGDAARAVGRGVRELAIAPMSLFSGMPRDTLRAYMKNLPQAEQMLKNPAAADDFLNETFQATKRAIADTENKAYAPYKKALEQTTEKVRITPAMKRFRQEIADAEAEALAAGNTPAAREYVESLKASYNNLFGGEVPGMVRGTRQVPTGFVDNAGRPITQSQQTMVPGMVKGFPEKVTARQADSILRTLNDQAGFQRLSGSPAMDVAGTLRGKMTAPEKQAFSFQGDIKNEIEKALVDVLSEGANQSKKEFGQARAEAKRLMQMLNTQNKISATLRNANTKSNFFKEGLLQKADTKFGTNLRERADLADALQTFATGNPSAFSPKDTLIGAVQRTPASATVGLLGGLVGGPALGISSGVATFLLTRPKAMRSYIRAARAAGTLPQALENLVPYLKPGRALAPAAAENAWLDMQP